MNYNITLFVWLLCFLGISQTILCNSEQRDSIVVNPYLSLESYESKNLSKIRLKDVFRRKKDFNVGVSTIQTSKFMKKSKIFSWMTLRESHKKQQYYRKEFIIELPKSVNKCAVLLVSADLKILKHSDHTIDETNTITIRLNQKLSIFSWNKEEMIVWDK